MLDPVLNEAQSLESAVSGFAVPQVASLLLLQSLPRFRSRHQYFADVVLIEVIKNGNEQVRKHGLAGFAADALTLLDRSQIQAGYRMLPELGFALMDDTAVAQRAYLTDGGQWDSSFRIRHGAERIQDRQRISQPLGLNRTLTEEQSRIFREIKYQTDDHLHVQGYAGTGKSFLIKSILMMLRSSHAKVIVLAERQRQLTALLAGLGRLEHLYPKTFGGLVSEMIPPNMLDAENRRMSRADYTAAAMKDDVVVSHLGIQSQGKFSPKYLAQAVRSTVMSFCSSDDSQIDVHHIPDWCSMSFDLTTRQAVLHYSARLWRETVLPTLPNFEPPLRTYHRVKWASLKRLTIPSRYTHVLIDECHDLSKPMLEILDRSTQAVISLGDEYQNLNGTTRKRSGVVRQRLVTSSVRSGQSIEAVVNPIIEFHPASTKLPFHGNPLNRTEIIYYDKPEVPDNPAVILTGDTWGLFEWTQRLATKAVEFELLSNIEGLNMFVNDCIELKRHGTRPRHVELFRFESWETLASHHQENPGFQRIERMLEKGYSAQDWMRTTSMLVRNGMHRSAVGLIGDVRNREFDDVMLVPDIIDHAFKTMGGQAFGAAGSVIYVAVTRARRRLIVPARLRNWVEEISAKPVIADDKLISWPK